MRDALRATARKIVLKNTTTKDLLNVTKQYNQRDAIEFCHSKTLMTAATTEFTDFWKQLYAELHSLSSEAKKRSSAIRQASDKSIEILKTIHSYEELSRHPDFVVPFVMSCSSKNAKLTTISMQCLQRLSATPCIPKEKLSDVLTAFIDATQLALEIKLKVLQVLPIFFKNYAKYIYGPLCVKLLQCCSNLLQLPNKSPMVVGTASATLQQLIDEIFERLAYERNDDDDSMNKEEIYDVLVGNNESIKVDVYRFDANKLFADLCSSFDLTDFPENSNREVLLEVKSLPINYGLEILESVLKNSKSLFLKYKDLQFLLRIKTVPYLLRCISSNKHFSTVLRSFRCIKLLIKREYVSVLELELEVILSLLIHGVSVDSDSPLWKKVLSLEVFMDISHNFGLLSDIYMAYDKFPDRKHILTNLLQELSRLLCSEDFENCLCESHIVERMDMPIISSEAFAMKTQLIHMLDKANAPPVNYTYVIWLILSISNEWSDGLSIAALDVSQLNNKSSDENSLEKITEVYDGIFDGLFEIHRKFLYSTSLDTPLFHSLIRAFQKLAHAAGILSMSVKLNKCLDLFSVAIVSNVDSNKESVRTGNQQQSTVLNALSESLIGTNPTEALPEATARKGLPLRNINQRQVSLFRALISLSVSLGPTLDTGSWTYILRTWQWISYYIYGPSADFMEAFYAQDVPSPPVMTKNEVISIENSIGKLFESTTSFSDLAFQALLGTLITESRTTLALIADHNSEEMPFNNPQVLGGHIQNCAYNKIFFITQIGELATYNCNRFLNDQKNKENWSLFMEYLVRLIGDRQLPNVALRLYATKTLTDIIRKATLEVGGVEDQEVRNTRFNTLESLIIDSLMDCIYELKKLDFTRDDIYNGVINAESEILFQLLSTLKDILNEFGDILSSSWFTVFTIINSPFQWVKKDVDQLLSDDEDDSSLVNGILQKHKQMIQVSYDVFKLISDDFLQALPLEVIKCVIDTIVNFVTQELNLNISFSSISQFWLVGDYLRLRKTISDLEDANQLQSEFFDDIKRGKLEETIACGGSEPYKVYNGLWLYLLRKLIECSKDKRIEVKNGAVQTFFRIIDSHSACFPDWNLIFLEVIKPLLTDEWSGEELNRSAEFWNHALQGFVKLYPSYLANFSQNEAATEQWITLLSFLQSLLNSGSTEITYVAVINYRNLLKSMTVIEDLPPQVLQSCIEIWSQYNVVYSDISGSSTLSTKSAYDCIQELITGFPFLYQIMMKYQGVTAPFVEKTLSLFNSAVRYPLLPEHTRDNTKPSSLQLAVLNGLSTFELSQKGDIEVLILFQLSMMITLPFETREKIEKKLLPKLTQSSRSRIPTFEAISYQAFQVLNRRLQSVGEREWSFLGERHMIKIMKNLGEVISRKSLIDTSSEKDMPLWILASQTFRDLSFKAFQFFPTMDMSVKLQNDFCEVFTNVAVSPLHRFDALTDDRTEIADVQEYSNYRDILMKKDIIGILNEEQLKNFISTVWTSSFLYQADEIEDEILKGSESLLDTATKLSTFAFSEIAGSTTETPLLSKYKCSVVCLKDLIRFVEIPGEEFEHLRSLSAPYLVSRIAFVLRRYISNESLVGRAPIPKVRKIELEILLHGLHVILESLLRDYSSKNDTVLETLKILHPLILRTIPISHKLEVLQKEVLELSLGFTKLVSK